LDGKKEVRVGIGWDLHPFGEGRPLVLGGIRIPYERGLVGHSDADVVIHALCDALLGALSLGDLGTLYPSSDPRYEGISSTFFLREVMGRVSEKGYRVSHVDLVIIAQGPKLAPFIENMRERLSKEMGVDKYCVSVKAKSPEGVGAIGRGEGISAIAVALLEKG